MKLDKSIFDQKPLAEWSWEDVSDLCDNVSLEDWEKFHNLFGGDEYFLIALAIEHEVSPRDVEMFKRGKPKGYYILGWGVDLEGAVRSLDEVDHGFEDDVLSAIKDYEGVFYNPDEIMEEILEDWGFVIHHDVKGRTVIFKKK